MCAMQRAHAGRTAPVSHPSPSARRLGMGEEGCSVWCLVSVVVRDSLKDCRGTVTAKGFGFGLGCRCRMTYLPALHRVEDHDLVHSKRGVVVVVVAWLLAPQRPKGCAV